MKILNEIQLLRLNYCLNPKFIKLTGSSKYIATRCNNCITCKRHNIETWDSRIINEANAHNNKIIVRLTINNECIETLKTNIKNRHPDISKLKNENIYSKYNDIATISIRRYLENLRRKNKTSIKHWLVTELRNTKTNILVIHGIMFTNNKKQVRNKWIYGNVRITKVNNDRLFKLVNYINNPNQKDKTYKPIILNSPEFNKKYIPKSNTTITNFESLLIQNRIKAIST